MRDSRGDASRFDAAPRWFGSAIRGLPWVVLALTLAHWVILVGRIPVFTSLRWWFWEFSEQPIDAPWLAPLLALLTLATLWAVLRSRRRSGLRLACLIALGFALQQGLGLLEGRGIDGIRDHIVYTGHAQFAAAAARQESPVDVIRDYERLAPRGVHGLYAKSKPPGQLLLYVFTDRIAQWLHPQPGVFEHLEWLQTFTSYSWPLLSCLVLIPIYGFARRYMHPECGFLACSLYLLVPSVNLMTLHTDQVFYPLFAMCTLLLVAVAADRGSVLLGIASGAWLYLSLFCSFGLAAVLPLAGAVALTLGRSSGARKLDPARLARLALGLLVGLVASDLLFRLAFDYDIALRYRNAMAHHLGWKGWKWSVSGVLYIGFLNTLEYAVWLGLPLAIFAFSRAARSLWEFARERFEPASALSTGLLVVFFALAFFARTKGEVSRLWLFLVPFVCLVGGEAFARMSTARRRWLLPLTLGLQGGTVLLTKVYQDF